MCAHQHLQSKAKVCHATGHRSLRQHQLKEKQAVLAGHKAGMGYAAGRRTNCSNAAGIRGIAKRTAEIVAKTDRTHAGGQRHRLAATRSTRGASEVPRVPSKAMQAAVSMHA